MKKKLTDYFVPHEGNDYSPHSLQKAAVLGMGMLVVLSFAIANIQSLIWISSDWLVSTILPSVIVDLTNDERADQTLGVLRRNPVLDAAASQKAQHMAENQYFSHYSPDGVSPWYWFSQVGYSFVHAGENLAIHFTDSDVVVDAWMNSSSHRANILNDAFTEIGVGAVSGIYNGFETVYVVQLFGTPALTVPETEVLISENDVVEVTPVPEEEPRQIAGSDEEVVLEDDTEISVSAERDPVAVPAPTTIEEVTVKEDHVTVYTDFISTSTNGVPAPIDPATINTSGNASPVATLMTRPVFTLEILYVGIGLFVLFSLVLSIVIEIRRQRPVQIAYGAGLIAVMALLFVMHLELMQGVVIV